ncbi:MAG TPA: LuxR C-terminal-related transcriptional regulator, partial [Anaerolineales bacterium]
TLGYLYYLNGEYAQAGQYLEDTIRSGKVVGAILNPAAAYCLVARLNAIQGRLNRSYELYQEAGHWIRGVGGQHLGAASLIEIGMAEVCCERNDLPSAQAHMKPGLENIHAWGKADDLVLAHLTDARIHRALGDANAAGQAVEKANRVVQTSGVFPEASHAAECARVEQWLFQGDLEAAGRWAASVQERLGPDRPYRFEDEVTRIALAKVLLARGKPEEAMALLSRMEEAARSAKRMGRVLQILVQKALAQWECGDHKQALATLSDCLELAGPEGYVRLFLDEGRPMRVLLAQWLSRARNDPHRIYASQLLAQFDAGVHMAAPEKGNRPAGLIEPLSPRELEVLHLIALGSTNQEIARQLFVSPGTVKAHTASIYRKLNAANRTEAARRARDLGILT